MNVRDNVIIIIVVCVYVWGGDNGEFSVDTANKVCGVCEKGKRGAERPPTFCLHLLQSYENRCVCVYAVVVGEKRDGQVGDR